MDRVSTYSAAGADIIRPPFPGYEKNREQRREKVSAKLSRYLYKSNVRPKELSLRAAKAAWQSVTPAAIGGAVLCTAEKRIPTTSLRTGLGMTTGGILPPVIISIYRQRRYHNFPLSSFNCPLSIVNFGTEILSLHIHFKTAPSFYWLLFFCTHCGMIRNVE